MSLAQTFRDHAASAATGTAAAGTFLVDAAIIKLSDDFALLAHEPDMVLAGGVLALGITLAGACAMKGFSGIADKFRRSTAILTPVLITAGLLIATAPTEKTGLNLTEAPAPQ